MNIKTSRPRNSNKHRNKRSPFYQTKEWKKLVREVWMRDDGMCQICKEQGIRHYLERSTRDISKQGTVDHITPRPVDAPYNPSTWDNKTNLRLIGTNHHAAKSATERKNI